MTENDVIICQKCKKVIKSNRKIARFGVTGNDWYHFDCFFEQIDEWIAQKINENKNDQHKKRNL